MKAVLCAAALRAAAYGYAAGCFAAGAALEFHYRW